MNHLTVSCFDAFSMSFLNNLIEFPCAEIAIFTFSFFMNFIKYFMNELTLFSTSAKDSPPEGFS